MASEYNALRKLNELIKYTRVAMMTTLREDGMPHSRPLATQQMETDGELWFFTGWTTEKAREIELFPRVNLSYADANGNTYVSVSGLAQLVRDPERARQLWNPLYKPWYPKGLDDANLALLKVTVDHVEYWDAPSGNMVPLAGFVRRAVTGQQTGQDEMELHSSER